MWGGVVVVVVVERERVDISSRGLEKSVGADAAQADGGRGDVF
jgi:hypothetical protein